LVCYDTFYNGPSSISTSTYVTNHIYTVCLDMDVNRLYKKITWLLYDMNVL